MANNKQKVIEYYYTPHNNYQIVMTPLEATLRDCDTYSQMVTVIDRGSKDVVWTDTFDTDEIFWSGVETEDKMLRYVKNVIDLVEDIELGDIS